MTDRTSLSFEFPACRRRRIEADFSGGEITSNGGVLLLRQADRLLGLTASVAGRLADARQRGKVEHGFTAMLRQRVFALALGYEDVNDHAALRFDLALQTAAGRDRALASPSTLSRFENAAGRAWAWRVHEVLVAGFIASFDAPPEELILDFDATDDAMHGKQEGRFFHGYYDHYCFLPLYVFCGERLLVSYLRPSKIDGAKHAWAILVLLVKKLRQAWPGVRIVFRGDGGFCRHQDAWLVRAPRRRLHRRPGQEQAAQPARRVVDGDGGKGLRGKRRQAAPVRRVHLRRRDLEADAPGDRAHRGRSQGRQPALHRHQPGRSGRKNSTRSFTARRGDMENRIKEQQLDLFADRTSCHKWWPNQFRLLLSSLAYTLLETIRRIGLEGTDMARAQAGTIRLKLLKIGAVILRNSRRVRFHLSSACPNKACLCGQPKGLRIAAENAPDPCEKPSARQAGPGAAQDHEKTAIERATPKSAPRDGKTSARSFEPAQRDHGRQISGLARKIHERGTAKPYNAL